MENRSILLIMFTLAITFIACEPLDMKFDKKKWNEKDDIFYAYRENMVNDLVKNHLKTGMTYKEVIELLGNSENYQENTKNTIYYEIMVDYGWDIDPQNSKTLLIEFTNDSTLKTVRIDNWTNQ